ncbi:glycoside hydrolase [Ramicandelaber brevisporus]|nr:glycoside hydrolase [Ramicandelaber brevisporus]
MNIIRFISAFLAILLAFCLAVDSMPAPSANKTLTGSPERTYIIGYYMSGNHDKFFSNLRLDLLTNIMFAFAIPEEDGSITLSEQDTSKLDSLVKEAAKSDTSALGKGKPVRVSLSVGGWTHSKHIPKMIASSASRSNFVRNAVDFAVKHNVDLDIDFEWPAGVPGECDSPKGVDRTRDTENFLLLLRELRKALDAATGTGENRKLLSLAVATRPFVDREKKPLKDMTEFAQVVDFVQLMAYDLGEGQASVVANAPLKVEGDDRQEGNISSVSQAVKSWVDAKFPANQIVLGVPFYGKAIKIEDTGSKSDRSSSGGGSNKRVFGVEDFKKNGLPAKHNGAHPQGDKDDNRVPSNGIWKYCNLFEQNLLKAESEFRSTSASDDWKIYWDGNTSTPWLANEKDGIMITYDDPASINAKVELAKKNKLAGLMAWELTYDTKEHQLLTVMNRFLPKQMPEGMEDVGISLEMDKTSDASGVHSASLLTVIWTTGIATLILLF